MTIDPNTLINTKAPPTGGTLLALEAWQSFDYYHSRPYPAHAFGPQQWPLDKGPVPTPLPYAKILIDEGAEFMYRGGPPSFDVPGNPDATTLLQQIIETNGLASRWVPLAVRAGNIGTLAAKWSYDANDEDCPIRIAFLSVPEECRVWFDPHDQTRMLMARVQYPYQDPADGKWKYFREEWTAEEWVTYHPKDAGSSTATSAASLAGYTQNFGDGDGWEVDQRLTNDFGVIPIVLIKNRVVEGMPMGAGDCWGSFRLMDRLALTMHGEDRASQLHSDPNLVITNATLGNSGGLIPGEPLEVNNSDPEKSADAKLLEPSGTARQYAHQTMDRWQSLLYKQVGMSEVDPATVTNKGNLTKAVFEMLYGRTIATCNHKRTQWGQGGMAIFFRKMLIGLANHGDVKEVRSIDRDLDVNVIWPDYFEATPDDIKAISDRTMGQISGGVLPLERGAKRIAKAEGMPDADIEDLLEELKAMPPKSAAIAPGEVTQAPDVNENQEADVVLDDATVAG